jgi:hypothetical protein
LRRWSARLDVPRLARVWIVWVPAVIANGVNQLMTIVFFAAGPDAMMRGTTGWADRPAAVAAARAGLDQSANHELCGMRPVPA